MSKATKWILLTLLALVIIVWAPIAKSPFDQSAHLYFLNVGQGDSILIEKGDYQVLIDGGPDESVLGELGKYMPLTDRKLELLVLTHPHADHLTGVNLVLERFEVEKIIYGKIEYDSMTYKKFNDLVSQKSDIMKSFHPEIGQELDVFENGKIRFYWVGQESGADNLNNSSVVTQFCFYLHCSLLMGDLEIDAQKLMLKDNRLLDISSEILKISHHGSGNGTDETLLEEVSPTYAVISVGKNNKFGHPNQGVIDLLKEKGISYFLTLDQTQEFVISKDGIVKK